MTLDLRTLALAASLLCTLQALGMVALWLLNRQIKGIGAWAASNVVNAAAMALITLQEVTPDKFLPFILPNTLNVLGAILFYTGTCGFTGQRERRWVAPVTLGTFLPLFLYFLYVDDSVVVRMYLMSAILGGFAFVCAYMLFTSAKGGWKLAANYTSSVFLFCGLLSIYRITDLWIGPAPTDNFDETPLQMTTYLTAVVAAYMWTFGAFLMINQRQTMEIHARHLAQRRMEEELMQAREEAEQQKALRQRQLLARDLHDGLGGITANLALLATLGREEDTAAARDDLMKHIESMAIEGNREIRTIMNTLESGNMSWAGWLGDLRQHAGKVTSGVGIGLEWSVRGPVPDLALADTAAAFSLLRAMKEALNNLARHSGASRATVSLDFRPRNLRVRIHDNGRGLPETPTPGRGLNNMRRRAEELGGSLRILKKNGVLLRFILPLPLQFRESKATPESPCLPTLTV